MGLDIPNLDEKNFDILIEEAITKLPSLSSEWTDYNPSDPGVTIIELLAWLSDINHYRLNRVGAKHKEAFLKILGLSRGENRAATVLVTLTSWRSVEPYDEDDALLELDPDKKVLVPKDTEIMNMDMRFVTQKDICIYPTNFDILALKTKEYGEEREIRRENFYPFSKELENDSYLIIELTHIIELEDEIVDEITFYVVSSEHSDEYIEHDALEWSCYKDDTKEWIEVNVIDYSNGFTNSGEIVVSLSIQSSKIRCKVKGEAYYETPPLVEKLLINSIPIRQEDEHKAFLGESSGYVNQHFILNKSPMSNTLEVKVGGKIWREVDDLQSCSSTEKVYMVKNSEIIFGDAKYGEVPSRYLDINVTYLSNEGSRGNIQKGSSWECENIKRCQTPMEVSNDYDGYGGENEKSFEEVISSYGSSLTTPKRAVSLSDYEFLALNTPNTRLAKVKATADKETNHVSVIVVPLSQAKSPKVNDMTRTKVEEYLDSRRLLTTRVSVIDPKYKAVNISVKLFSKKHDPEILSLEIKNALDLYLHLLNGAKDANGWSFGQSLYLSELYQIVSKIDGVDTIESLKINNSTSSLYETDKDTIITSGTHNITVKGIDPFVCRRES
jgi:hypothetical protein